MSPVVEHIRHVVDMKAGNAAFLHAFAAQFRPVPAARTWPYEHRTLAEVAK